MVRNRVTVGQAMAAAAGRVLPSGRVLAVDCIEVLKRAKARLVPAGRNPWNRPTAQEHFLCLALEAVGAADPSLDPAAQRMAKVIQTRLGKCGTLEGWLGHHVPSARALGDDSNERAMIAARIKAHETRHLWADALIQELQDGKL